MAKAIIKLFSECGVNEKLRIIADKVEKTEHVQGGEGHRPSALFRYKKN